MQSGPTLSEIIERILSLLSLVWGILFLFPGELMDQAVRIDLSKRYAGDSVWGIALIVAAIALFFPIRRFNLLRLISYVYLWLFWSAMGVILLWRGSENGWQPTDFLISSVFIALALIHAMFYTRAAYTR